MKMSLGHLNRLLGHNGPDQNDQSGDAEAYAPIGKGTQAGKADFNGDCICAENKAQQNGPDDSRI